MPATGCHRHERRLLLRGMGVPAEVVLGVRTSQGRRHAHPPGTRPQRLPRPQGRRGEDPGGRGQGRAGHPAQPKGELVHL